MEVWDELIRSSSSLDGLNFRRMDRRKQRQRFRTYFRSLARLSAESFYRKTAVELKSACMRSSISDSVMIARAIHKRDNRRSSSNTSSPPLKETSERRFVKIFLAPFPQPSDVTGNSPLQAAAWAGAKPVVHFILACTVLFLLGEDRFSSESHTIMAWLHKVALQNEETGDNHGLNEQSIWTMVGSSFSYLYERKFSLLDLLRFVSPYLAPYARLDQSVKALSEKAKKLARSTSEGHSHTALDYPTDEAVFEAHESAVLVETPGVNDLCADDFSAAKDDGYSTDSDWEIISSADSSIISF